MIWYFDNAKPLKANFVRGDAGTDAYLYLPGPSLRDVNFDVKGPGMTAFAVNTAYPKVSPNYWVGMDKPACYDGGLMYESFPKFFRGTYARKEHEGKLINLYPQTYFADIGKPEHGISDMFKIKEGMLVWFNHTLAVALHLILLMGHKKIHFVGCDLGGDSDYYDDRKLDPDKRDYNRRLYGQQAIFLEEFAQHAKLNGVMCISCTEDSSINRFMPYIPLKSAIEASQSVVKRHEIKHAVEVSKDENEVLAREIRWGDPIREKGVLVFADKNAEWMLDWWYENYRKWNDFPVLFVDIGLSPAGATFCKARGSYVKLPPMQLKGWFLKPFALKMTTFKKTLYMDVDVEVRGSVYDLFEHKGFAIAKDKLNSFSTVPNPVNSGVIVYEHGNELIDRWCENTIRGWHKFRSDQDVLDHMEKKYTEIPHEQHWLRIMGENKRAVLYHYTGPIGRKIIKEAIASL